MFTINYFALKNVATCQIMFFHEKIFCEFMCFPLNGLEFYMFHYYICVDQGLNPC
jgi:hypothetical protein